MPVTLTGATNLESALAAGIRAGDGAALRILVKRDHAVASFFADAVGTQNITPIWINHLHRIMDGSLADGLRCALLESVYEARDPAADTAPEIPARLGNFAEVGDRWEGWWADGGEPPAWPDGCRPGPADAQVGLRRVPFAFRALLVLREVAELTPDEAARVLGDEGDQTFDLDDARDAYLSALDQEVAGHGCQ